MLHHNRQGPNCLDILVFQRRCCPKSCDNRVRYGFVGQGGAPTLQENDKKTVADFLGSQQKLGRRFKKDTSIGMSFDLQVELTQANELLEVWRG